ncbi:hypothetical protein KFE25_012805 [Diacronema lutheri]|uniref:C-CAP/cofactor C-like domain-containing protein n=2 Tax=Diacronema lutheri TaxID=2081491 RepID=A0A8J6C727_DIALT|nr:hypothetical protein KFE25_012805 [Diacronema lutheri]
MGCIGSSAGGGANPTISRARAAADADGGIIMGNGDRFRKELDPKDFMLVGRSGETVVRAPGSIHGQQFVISDCTDCDILLCDHVEMVTIDRCNDCRIFVGPCESSLFVRNCVGLKLVAACRQFRTRDCERLDVLMHCVSQPSIETSSAVRFGCYSFFYFALPAQFEAARLSVFNNRWSEVYNFSPKHGAATLLDGADASPPAFLKPGVSGLHDLAPFVTREEADGWRDQSAVPSTLGAHAAAAGSTVLVCAPALGTAGALELCARLAAAGLQLARTLEFEADGKWRGALDSALARMPGGGGLGRIAPKARVVVLQVAGADSAARAAEVVDVFNAARGGALACAAADAASSAEMAAALFVQEDAGHALG